MTEQETTTEEARQMIYGDNPPAPDHEDPEPVDIIGEIVNYLNTYMVFQTSDQPLALALWAVHTYTFDPSFPRSPWLTPYMYVNSNGPACGKSVLLELLEGIVRNPVTAGSLTASSLYRLVGDVKPTIMLDEVDTIAWNGADEGLRNTYNTGYKHNGFTYRTEGGEAVKFHTFAAKLLAGIRDDRNEIPRTILTRAIPINLAPKPADAEVEPFYSFMAGPVAEELAARIRIWVKQNALAIAEYMPKPDERLHSRQFELAFSLLGIARVAGCEQEAREAIIRLLAPEPEKERPEVRVFRIIKEAFDNQETEIGIGDKIHTATICAALGGINGKALSGILRPRGIDGNNTVQVGVKADGKPDVRKGYWRHQFVETWKEMGL